MPPSALLLLAILAAPSDLSQMLSRVQALAAAQQLDEAERVAREAVAAHPSSVEAKVALADVLSWRGRYRDAIGIYDAVLQSDPRHPRARLGRAHALYWSGDLRAAVIAYEPLQDVAEAREALAAIRAASRPGIEIQADHRSDDQPFEVTRLEAGGFAFSSPATRWGGRAGSYRFEEGAADDASYAMANVSTKSGTTNLSAEAGAMRFPDGEILPLASFSAARALLNGTASVELARRELFGAVASTASHPYADALTLQWSRPNASIRAQAIDYFDDNRGFGFDSWLLVPLRSGFSAGGSLTVRDTEESRFTPFGIYAPYYSPLDLAEARAIVVFSRALGKMRLGAHADYGVAREALKGSYHPWRVAARASIPAGPYSFAIELDRISTAFYSSHEIRTSLARRF